MQHTFKRLFQSSTFWCGVLVIVAVGALEKADVIVAWPLAALVIAGYSIKEAARHRGGKG